jgi:hypothetical protein
MMRLASRALSNNKPTRSLRATSTSSWRSTRRRVRIVACGRPSASTKTRRSTPVAASSRRDQMPICRAIATAAPRTSIGLRGGRAGNPAAGDQYAAIHHAPIQALNTGGKSAPLAIPRRTQYGSPCDLRRTGCIPVWPRKDPFNGDRAVTGRNGTAGTERTPGGCPGRGRPGPHLTPSARPVYPMLEDIIEVMRGPSREFRRPTGMTLRI